MSTFAQENSPSALYNKANQAYQEQKYPEALKLYKEIYNSGLHSSELNYNLGNAYFRLDSLGKSILHYERALKLNPSDEAAKKNIEYARKGIEFKASIYPQIFYKKWISNLIYAFGSIVWFVLSVLLVWLCLYLARKYLYAVNAKDQKTSFFSAAICLFFSLLFLVFAITRMVWDRDQSFGVIHSKTVQIKTAPSADSQSQFKLSPGNKVKVQETFEDWSKILLEDDKEGWMETKYMEMI